MTFVCLAASSWPPAATQSPELGTRALTLAPRIRLELAQGLLWADARGLDADAIALGLLALADELGCAGARVGIADTPVAARVAARQTTDGPADGATDGRTDGQTDGGMDAGDGWAERAGRVRRVAPGEDRGFLAPLDVGVLEPPPAPSLFPLLAGIGVECCGDLARLDRESVEVRFGHEGVRIWRLARADDPRPLFTPRPRELPHAELEWADYELDRQEQVVFIVNALLGSVCDALDARSQGAHAMALEFALADRSLATHPVRCSTPTADRKVWLRVIRAALEQVTFEAPVMRIALRVEGAAPLADRQGDLFDLGFGSARATEASLTHLLDRQDDALVLAVRSRHPLPERRVRWLAVREPTAWEPRRPRAGGADAGTAPRLTLQLLETPQPVDVELEPRRDADVPTRYRVGYTVYPLRSALGPDRISGGHGDVRYDREYFQSVRDDGTVVLLHRDRTENQWFLSGWWD